MAQIKQQTTNEISYSGNSSVRFHLLQNILYTK